MTAPTSSSLPRTNSFYIAEEKQKEELQSEVKRLWPHDELHSLARERIRHIDEELAPRIGLVEDQIQKIGEAIKAVSDTILGVKNADVAFFERVKSIEGRIAKMLEPSQEYQNLQAQNKRDLVAIISTICAMAVIITGVIVAAVLLL